MKFYPYEKGGGGKSFSHAKGGWHKKFWGSFSAVAIFKGGGHKKCPLFKRGGAKHFTLS